MPHEIIFFTGVAGIFAAVLMAATWLCSMRFNNLGFVDIVWSGGFLPLVVFYAVASAGNPVRRTMIAGMAGLWSCRLALHVGGRVIGHHPQEDVRYGQLREDWGAAWRVRSLVFFLIQAVVLVGLSLVFVPPCLNPLPAPTALEWAGAVVWLAGLAGESVADAQLRRFKAGGENKGKICQTGLWNYSRHPNYFFEWLVWVGYFIFAWNSPGGCWTVLGPGLMLFFLLRVTGVPLTEKLSVQSKGEAYRQYQRTTSAFVPWFKKKTIAG